MGGEKRGRERRVVEGKGGRSFHVKQEASVWLLIDDFCPLEV